MNYAFGILIYYRQKSIIRHKIYIKDKTLTDRIEPMILVLLLHHSTTYATCAYGYLTFLKI